MRLRVLTWNLMHGRAVPPAGHDLFEEFACALEGWDWDLALLQEAPPWWPARFANRLGGAYSRVLTSRNALLGIRRAIAVRRPDLIKSNGGGSNAILARRGTIAEHRTHRLCWLPERRWLQAIRILASGQERSVWIGNLHATVHNDQAALRDCRTAAREMVQWAGPAPAVLGGDFNLRELSLEGFAHAGGFDVDHVFVRGLEVESEATVLHRGRLSDHAPVVVNALLSEE